MRFGDAIGECFFNYANFRDRAARAEYWWWVLFSTGVLLVALLLDFLVFRDWSVGPFYLVFGLAAILPGFSVTVRRLHDTGRSGWWLLIPAGSGLIAAAITIAAAVSYGTETPPTGLLLLIGAVLIVCVGSSILLLVWMAIPSMAGNNAYGPNRYAGA